jgi:hypothetical protein
VNDHGVRAPVRASAKSASAVASTDDMRKIDQRVTKRLSPEGHDPSLGDLSRDERHVQGMLARFGPKPHAFTNEDRAKAVAVAARRPPSVGTAR